MNPTRHPRFLALSGLKAATFIFSLLVPVFLCAQLSVSLSGVSPTCAGFTNGTVTADVTDGTGPFIFSWSNGFSGPELIGVGAGNYSVTVTDVDGTTATASFNLTEPAGLNAGISLDDVCSGNGNATSSVTGGTGAYTYSWDNGATTANVTGLGAGLHCLTVTDASGCQDVACITVPAAMTLDLVVQGLACFNFCDASIEAVITGGTGPFTFLWSNGATGQVNENLGPGTYSVTVTDANGCTISGTATVGNPLQIDINVSVTNPPCGGGGTGSASATVSGGTGPYTFQWSNGANSANVTNLSPGVYTLTVTDALGCTGSTSITVVQESDIVLQLDTSPSSACGFADGTASVTITGGMAPFTIQWSNGGTGNSISGLAPGTYSVVVTDANGCGATGQVTVGGTPPIDLHIMGVNAGCAANGSASAMVTPGTGTAPFTFLWSTGATTSIINNLTTGTYSVTATDAAGCTASAQVTITGTANIDVTVVGTNINCFGSADGSATAIATGGTGTITYQWSNGGTGATITNLPVGTYFVTVTDTGSGCTSVSSVFISQPGELIADVTGSNATCAGGDGSATATATGGTAPYTFAWSNGGTGATITGLNPGFYVVTVTDINGCTDMDGVTISQDNAPAISIDVSPISGNDADDGSLTVVISGGTAPFDIEWSTGATTATISNLGPGTYIVTVTDANGCLDIDSTMLFNPGCIGDRVWNDNDLDGCQDGGEIGFGGVTVTLTGTDVNGNPVNMTTTTSIVGQYLFDGLMPGTYTVHVELPTDYIFSPANTCINDFTDSDFNSAGNSQTITLAEGQCNVTIDAGIHHECPNVTDPGEICCDQVLCGPGVDPDPIISVTPASGGSGTVQYMWMYSTIPGPFDPNAWLPVPGAMGASYDPGPLSETTYFIRCTKSSLCDDWLESNTVTITVDDEAVAEITGPNLVCVGDTATYSAPNNGPGATYFWDFGPWATPSTSTAQSVTVTWNQFGVVYVTLVVSTGSCTSTATMGVAISNSPIICGNALVVNVNNMDDAVMIDWNVEPVPGNIEFLVQRSADGQHYETLAELPQVTGQGMYHYSFADFFPKKGNAFYRVEVKENDAHVLYSNEVRIARFGQKENFIIYPNPVSNHLTIECNEEVQSAVQLEVFSPEGKLVLMEQLPEGAAMNYPLNMQDLKGGTYLLKITFNDGEKEVMKFVKK